MRLDPAGWPFIAGALALALVAGAVAGWPAGLPFLVATAFFVFFFRDPDRRVPQGENNVVAPADGRVIVAGPPTAGALPPGVWQQVSIFLSPLDVHVNRAPVSGRVTRVTLTRGRFLPAYRHDSGLVNERSEVWIDHDGQTIVVRQIVGILARRVVCRVHEGAEMRAGDRFGIMKFGSRIDVLLPGNAAISVEPGEQVRGGETVIAVLQAGSRQIG